MPDTNVDGSGNLCKIVQARGTTTAAPGRAPPRWSRPRLNSGRSVPLAARSSVREGRARHRRRRPRAVLRVGGAPARPAARRALPRAPTRPRPPNCRGKGSLSSPPLEGLDRYSSVGTDGARDYLESTKSRPMRFSMHAYSDVVYGRKEKWPDVRTGTGLAQGCARPIRATPATDAHRVRGVDVCGRTQMDRCRAGRGGQAVSAARWAGSATQSRRVLPDFWRPDH